MWKNLLYILISTNNLRWFVILFDLLQFRLIKIDQWKMIVRLSLKTIKIPCGLEEE